MISFEDYSTIQRIVGQLEGIACVIENENISSQMFDSLEAMEVIIDRNKPEVSQ